MKASRNFVLMASSLLIASACILNMQNAEAGRLFRRGPNGSVGAFDSSTQNGSRRGARALGRNAGAGARSGQWSNPNGASLQGSGAFAYKKGVGEGRNASWSGTNANGASGSGFAKNQYNAQTGQGARSSSEQLQNAAGKDVGYNASSTYAKGQGGTTTINTDNKGAYDVNWQKGQPPAVTPVPAAAPQ